MQVREALLLKVRKDTLWTYKANVNCSVYVDVLQVLIKLLDDKILLLNATRSFY